jgi:parallel beta-helix repeat protein
MNLRNCFLLFGLAGFMVAAGCSDTATEPATDSTQTATPESATESADEADDAVVTFSPGPEAQKQVLEELILAEEGTVFQFEEGIFEFTDGLSLTVDNVTIRGRGMDKTILSFKNQQAGAEGLYITSNNVLVEDLAIEDTKGNASKSLKADNIVYRRVRAEWTGGPLSTNGAYGFYPVSSRNVTVDSCVAIGASDAGIYVGQSINVIVKNCRAEFNVAGIEIENCYNAEVFGCEATNNTGGILVFDLPDLPQQRGHNVRVYKNNVHANNTGNFAPEGNIVGTVPAGTGIEIMANSKVEVFENEILNHGTNNVLIISYLAAGKDIKDPNYYPYPESIHIHHNQFSAGGDKPDNDGGKLMAAILGSPLPDIVWDGVVSEANLVDGKLPQELGISIHDNTKEDGEVTFANLGGLPALVDPANAKPTRELTPHQFELPPVEPVTLSGVE